MFKLERIFTDSDEQIGAHQQSDGDTVDADIVTMSHRQRRLIEEALHIEQEEALKAGTLGYMTRTFAQVTLPHTNPDTLYYERTNGKLTLVIPRRQNSCRLT